jgi:hypothetical protein
MSTYRNEKLIRELERDLEENECGASDCLWLFCCGIFGLVCVIPKYNKRKFANDRLLDEMKKPERPRTDQDQNVFTPPLPAYSKGSG